jgi:uncharacterized protein (TIRG00374 family)
MIRRAFFVLGLGVAIYLLIPRLGGLSRDFEALRHADVGWMLLGVVAEGVSISCYVWLYRSLLQAEEVSISWHAAGRGVMSAFLVSHLVPGGAAAGTMVNVRTMELEGVPARRTGLALALCVVLSDLGLALLFLVGLVYSLIKQNVPYGYVAGAAVIIPILAALIGTVFLLAFHRDLGARAVRKIGNLLHRIRHKIDPEALERAAAEIVGEARARLRGRRFLGAMAFSLSNWVLDILVLYWFFLAVGHHQKLGSLLVAYALANIAAAIPITPAGLGFVEATLIAVSVGFGAPRQVAVVAVLGYRIVNFWLPLPVGLYAYVHSRARPAAKR